MSSAGVLDGRHRHHALDAMESGELDLLIIGGGITGLGAALDAASRGASVGLVEAGDLASGTSSKSTKLIHGGLRYLEMGDLGLVREALRERELLLTRLAPHLVSPVRLLWPLRGRGWERIYLGAGLALYDTLGGARSVPRHRHLSKRAALRAAPVLRSDALVGAVQFSDATEDDARMAVFVARTAASFGAWIATRARVVALLQAGGRVTGAEVVDNERGDRLTLLARHVAVAVGAWTQELLESCGLKPQLRIRPSKGIHLFVARDRLPMDTGILTRTEKSVLSMTPFADGWLIGDTDTPWEQGLGQPVPTGADIDYLLARTNALLREPLTREDVNGVTAGLRPLVGSAESGDTTRLSRSHVVRSPLPGLSVIAGGKYTTYRVMAADLIDSAVGDIGGLPPSRTAQLPLLGAEGFGSAWTARAQLASRVGLPSATIDRLFRRYGTLTDDLVGLMTERPELSVPVDGAPHLLGAEVVYACTHELALHLADVLERRSRLVFTASDRGLHAAPAVAALMADELGWNDADTRVELTTWARQLDALRAAEAELDDERALAAYYEAAPGVPASGE